MDPEWTSHEAMALWAACDDVFGECATHGVDPEWALPSVVAATGVWRIVWTLS